MIRIQNIKVPLGNTNYSKLISQNLNLREKYIKNVKLVKQSVDARREVVFNCSFDFETDNEEQLLLKYPQLKKVIPYQYIYPRKNDKEVVIIGSGPAGLFCAYILAQVGQKVTVVERGQPIEQRIQDVNDLLEKSIFHSNSNIAFGEGGAGTFSDGKLTTGIKNERIRFVLETFVKYGAPEDILYLSMPHIGTDYLRKVIVNMRKDMESKGVQFLFDTQMIDFSHQDKYEVVLKQEDKIFSVSCDSLVLAIGHSARDTYEMLYEKGVPIIQKPFAIGVRIEHLQEKINQIQYKKNYQSPYLKPANYKLAVQTKDKRGVYSFCMCPGGVVVPSFHEEGTLCVNGMSYYDRDGKNANSAILVNVKCEDFESNHPLAGIYFQRKIEERAYKSVEKPYYAPIQLAKDFMNYEMTTSLNEVKPTYQPGYSFVNMHDILPSFISESLVEGFELMNKKMKGFIDDNTLITGVETRSSAPIRIVRDSNFQSYDELYPIGEGAGYAGGIMSSSVDGIMCAEKILEGDK